ncbi:hypothetical protein PGTUg99_032681 [Puccinia graminis f. sp. tritici]|uniref:Uncharacterized protein n=1 Tax=Puccinia graminis f. sp. tritici TaxID=56615 RepID=A0A5B0R897_PUCGR|nr:hypothetical protein PGTUg99_032681 [Puccinia graminis f. sp. tritici]
MGQADGEPWLSQPQHALIDSQVKPRVGLTCESIKAFPPSPPTKCGSDGQADKGIWLSHHESKASITAIPLKESGTTGPHCEFHISPIDEAVAVTSKVIKQEPEAENVPPPDDEPTCEEIKAKKTPVMFLFAFLSHSSTVCAYI